MRASALLAAALCCGASWSQPAAPTPPHPDPAVRKIENVVSALQSAEQAAKGRGQRATPIRFEFTATELNAYARYALQVRPRPGLRSVSIKLFPNNYVSTLTTIDFDAVEKMKPGTIPALLKPLLRGQKQIWLDCRFQAANSRATFQVEKAYFEKLRLPAFFVEKMIEILAARQPEKYDTTKPLPLPFGLKRLWTKAQALSGQN